MGANQAIMPRDATRTAFPARTGHSSAPDGGGLRDQVRVCSTATTTRKRSGVRPSATCPSLSPQLELPIMHEREVGEGERQPCPTRSPSPPMMCISMTRCLDDTPTPGGNLPDGSSLEGTRRPPEDPRVP